MTTQSPLVLAAVALLGAAIGLALTRDRDRGENPAPQPIEDLTTSETVPVGPEVGDVETVVKALDALPAAAKGLDSLSSARARANESAALATLRSLAAAQMMAQVSCAIDADGDGIGEFGFLAEMAGATPLRGRQAFGPVAMDPPMLAPSFGTVTDDGSGQGCVERSGYLFKVYLPAEDASGVAEAASGGGEGVFELVAPDRAEAHWCAYAWPVSRGRTGTRAFFINEFGDLLESADADYDGRNAPPRFADAYVAPAMDVAPGTDGGSVRFAWTRVE